MWKAKRKLLKVECAQCQSANWKCLQQARSHTKPKSPHVTPSRPLLDDRFPFVCVCRLCKALSHGMNRYLQQVFCGLRSSSSNSPKDISIYSYTGQKSTDINVSDIYIYMLHRYICICISFEASKYQQQVNNFFYELFSLSASTHA